MNEIQLNLPPGSVVKGTLLRDYEMEDLDQEILEIDLPGGLTIDVGWYPQHDAHGSFQISVYRDYWENQETAPVLAATTDELANKLQEIAARFYSPKTVLH